MSSCCICQFPVRNPKNIYAEAIGQPPILISDLVVQCTRGTNYTLIDSTICKKCCEKLSRYHKSIQIAKKLRQEILQLIRSPYIIKEFKSTCSRKEFKSEDEHTVKCEDVVTEREESLDVASDDETEPGKAAAVSDDDPSAEVEEEEHLFINKNGRAVDEMSPEEFQMIDLDIENEIIIHEADGHGDVNIKQTLDEEGEAFKEDTLSEFEDQIDETIEYLISDGDGEYQDHDSSGDYTVNIKCPNCPEQFCSRRAYNAHTKREHFPGYVCDQCGKTLQSYSGFIGHLQNHESVKQFECPECGERFNRKFRLKHHMAWHTGETPFQCEVCSKRFVHKVALYKHKMIHDNDTKKLECQVCEFKTRTKAHLERHMRSHTGAKPFSCPVCNKRFSQMYNMKAHLREHENPGCNRQRRFHCQKCTHTFINEQNFVKHVQRGDCTAAQNADELMDSEFKQ